MLDYCKLFYVLYNTLAMCYSKCNTVVFLHKYKNIMDYSMNNILAVKQSNCRTGSVIQFEIQFSQHFNR